MALNIPAINKQDSAGNITVSNMVFNQQYNEPLIHQLVVRYLAGARAGTATQKNRSDVRGGGKKPWRQKGTGNARAGTVSSPIWRSGGVTFASRPRSYTQKLNKKMYKIGVRSIFSELLRQKRLLASNDIVPDSPKTKNLASKLSGVAGKHLLIITEKLNENLVLAARNLSYVAVATVSSVSPVDLIVADKVITTTLAIKQIEERLA